LDATTWERLRFCQQNGQYVQEDYPSFWFK
jgi:hypothetical protein